MDFRWVATIALWTLLIGPVIGPPAGHRAATAERAPAKVAPAKPAKAVR